MSILCGTDCSDAAQAPLRVAMELARRRAVPLHLAGSLDAPALEFDAGLRADALRSAERQLERLAARVRERGVPVATHLSAGALDGVLAALAAQYRTELVVVGAPARPAGACEPRSAADALAQRAKLPVLFVRAAEPFEAWLAGVRPLRIVMGADSSRCTDHALEQVQRLRTLSPCDVTAVHLYVPAHVSSPRGASCLDPEPDVTKPRVRALSHRLASAEAPGAVYVYCESHLGPLGERLAAIATERNADLLVLGSPCSAEGDSIAREALFAAETSVLMAPP